MADGKVVINTELDNAGLEKGLRNIKGSLGGLKGIVAKLGAAIAAAFAVQRIVQFGKDSVDAARALSDALTGLQSIMDGQGRSFSHAQKFIEEYVADGLIPATNAITAYKNLALRGYDDSQIQQVMTALKDSAAFGRQSSYTMGEAVESATEGLKNENSILVDNAGVTKNVAKMWQEYADSIGVSVNSLTQAQKVEAEVNGILEESKYQTGDAAKVAGTFSGQLMQLSFRFNELKVAVGNAIIPVAQRILPVINTILAALTKLANAFAAVMSAIFGKATVQSSAIAGQNEAIAESAAAGAAAEDKLAGSTKAAGKAAKNALGGLDELHVLQQENASGGGSAGGGGGAGAGSVPVSAELEVEDTVSPKIQAIVDKIGELLAPLRKIDFQPLADAFNRLKEAVSPLARTLFAGLEWAWYNLFVPLAAWTIEDALPAFLEVLSGALTLLNSVLQALQPLAQWMWDSFLQPLAAWTGGVIVTVLEQIADALYAVSDWIMEHQALMESIAIQIGAFAAAWVLVNGAITIWNAIGVVATGITGAFGAAVAFLSSPITIVIAAVGALIAIIVLLVRNWDTVKEVAARVWDGIVAIWQNVCGWFKEVVLQPLQEAFQWTVGKVVGFVNGLVQKIIDAANNIGQALRDVFQWIKKNVLKPLSDGFKGTVNGILGFVNGLVQAVVDAVNCIISAINTLSFEVPIWVPKIGGSRFGFHLSPITAPQVPYLAKGAVIPPNAEFLAVLGDQKNGRNLEAPEALLRQIVREEGGGTARFEAEQPIELLLDGEVFYRAMTRIGANRGARIGGAFAEAR